MQTEAVREQAHQILDRLPAIKIGEALNYLKFLDDLPDEQLEALEELLESLGWGLLGFEAAEKDWE